MRPPSYCCLYPNSPPPLNQARSLLSSKDVCCILCIPTVVLKYSYSNAGESVQCAWQPNHIHGLSLCIFGTISRQKLACKGSKLFFKQSAQDSTTGLFRDGALLRKSGYVRKYIFLSLRIGTPARVPRKESQPQIISSLNSGITR